MAGIRTENKIYEVGMYCRLSKDDGTDNESASIATQKSILTDYVKKPVSYTHLTLPTIA